MPRELIAAFIRAFGDDEGHVYDTSIDFYSNNRNLLNDILVLINHAFPEIKTSYLKINTKSGKNIKYSFTIYNGSQETYLNLIGFDHVKKNEDLIFSVSRKTNKISKSDLLDVLRNSNFTAKQISRLLGVRHITVLHCLNKLRKLDKVKIIKKERWANVWSIN